MKHGIHWTLERLYDKWQRIRRCPEYIEFCQGLPFSENGTVDPLFDLTPEKQTDYNRICEKYGLSLVIPPEKDLKKEMLLQFPIFSEPLAVRYEYQRLNPEAREAKDVMKFSPIWDSHHIKLRIDIRLDRRMNEILDEVKEHIQHGRNLIDQKHSTRTEKERLHLKSRAVSYRVWDMRKDRTPFEKIARELSLQQDAAKKKYAEAFKLITGKPFAKALDKTLFRQRIAKRASQTTTPQAWDAVARAEEVGQKETQIDNIEAVADVSRPSAEEEVIRRETLQRTCDMCEECTDTTCNDERLDFMNGGSSQWTPCPNLKSMFQSD